MKKLLIAITSLFLGSSAALAGDVAAGNQKSTTCAACHGTDGNSSIPMNPSIAGLSAKYLEKQLMDLRLGAKTNGKQGRYNPVMSSQAASLSDQDIADLAAFYASKTMKPNSTPEDSVALGQQLYRAGDAKRGIAACIACHGPRGEGMNLAGFPKISGQHHEYLKTQLEEFREGKRKNDPNGMMRDIAKQLTNEDIQALSNYLGGLN